MQCSIFHVEASYFHLLNPSWFVQFFLFLVSHVIQITLHYVSRNEPLLLTGTDKSDARISLFNSPPFFHLPHLMSFSKVYIPNPSTPPSPRPLWMCLLPHLPVQTSFAPPQTTKLFPAYISNWSNDHPCPATLAHCPHPGG